MKETQIQIRDDGFGEIAQMVLRAVGEIADGVSRVAGETVITAVKAAYTKGYGDGFRAAMRQLEAPLQGDDQ